MDARMDKATFLETLRVKRAEWDALLAEVGEPRMAQPGPAGEWSLKDSIAHVTWCEREMVGVLRARALVGSHLWNVSQDERNAAVYRQNRDRSLSDVLAEAQQHSARILHPPADYPCGERQYSVEDPGGHRWTFSQTIANVVPSPSLARMLAHQAGGATGGRFACSAAPGGWTLRCRHVRPGAAASARPLYTSTGSSSLGKRTPPGWTAVPAG